MVVAIVTKAIPDVILLCACSTAILGFKVRIQASAVCAIVELLVFARITTAVTIIPIASAIVVAIVTETIADEILLLTGRAAFFDLKVGIETLAVTAVIRLNVCATTITFIPVAAALVVFVVTESIPLVGWFSARPITRSFFISAIKARAIRTEIVVIGAAAAVSAVPITTAIVVAVIAEAIPLPVHFLTAVAEAINATVPRAFIRAIEAFAICAVVFLDRDAATIA